MLDRARQFDLRPYPHGSEKEDKYYQEAYKKPRKMTGIELIAQERKEQIEKHGYDEKHDETHNEFGELGDAAVYLITSNDNYWPKTWNTKTRDKFDKKGFIDRLVIAGALIAAEIDKIQRSHILDMNHELTKGE